MLHERILKTEKIGIVISVICAIHCLIMPFVLIYAGKHSMSHHHHCTIDNVLLALASIFMAFTVYQSLNKFYFNKILLAVVFFGLLLT